MFATARNKDALTDLTALGIDALSLEVNSPDSIESVRRYVSEWTGGSLDYLVNNASVTSEDYHAENLLTTFIQRTQLHCSGARYRLF